ncbi:MAG: O-antigen ligase family protein, partial [Mariprofundaceae bacterium]|nr:O-antigen ligase family protein [Mariprofundaceae bacterium]
YILDYLWFGSGLGSYQFLFPQYQPQEISSHFFEHAHNDYLELFAETGLFGMILAGFFMYYLIVPAVRLIISKRKMRDKQAMLCLGALTACLSMLIHALFEFNFHIPANVLLFVFFVSMVAASVHLAQAKRAELAIVHATLARHHYVACVLSAILFSLTVIALNLQHYKAQNLVLDAQTLMVNKQPDVAIETLQLAHKISPLDYSIVTRLADFFQSRSTEMSIDYDQDAYLMASLKTIDVAISLFPFDGALWYKKASVLHALGREEHYNQALEQAVHYLPSAFYTQYAWAKALFLSGNYKKSAIYFSHALALRPQLLHEVLLFTLKHKDHKEFLDAMFAKNASLYWAAGLFYLQQKLLSDAMHALNEAIHLNPTPAQAVRNLSALWRTNHRDIIVQEGERYLQQWPSSAALTNTMASYYLTMGFNEKVAQLIHSFLKKHKGNKHIYNILFELYLHQKNFEAAEKLVLQEVHTQPNKKSYAKLARVYQVQNRMYEALRALKSALHLAPHDDSLHYQIGNIYNQLHMETLAIQHWNQCLPQPYCQAVIINMKKRIGMIKPINHQ